MYRVSWLILHILPHISFMIGIKTIWWHGTCLYFWATVTAWNVLLVHWDFDLVRNVFVNNLTNSLVMKVIHVSLMLCINKKYGSRTIMNQNILAFKQHIFYICRSLGWCLPNTGDIILVIESKMTTKYLLTNHVFTHCVINNENFMVSVPEATCSML